MASLLGDGMKIASQISRTIGKAKVADIDIDHASKHVDMSGSGPGDAGAGAGSTGVFGADNLANNKPGRHLMVKKRMFRFKIPEGNPKEMPTDGQINCGTNQKSGWFVFPWQNFFQKSLKPRDFVGLNNLAKRWRVVKTTVEIDNITPEIKFKSATSSSMQFPNVYFEMYEDEEGDLNGYNINFLAYDSGIQSYERTGGLLELRPWNYCFDASVASQSSSTQYYFNAANHNLYNGSGVSFGRQVDKIKRTWQNPDKHWRHSHAPMQTQIPRIQIQAQNANHAAQIIRHNIGKSNTTPFGAPAAGYGGIPLQTTALLDTGLVTGKGYPQMDSDQLSGENNATNARVLGHPPLHTNGTKTSYQHLGTCMMDYMTGIPVFSQPPHIWLMRATDYSDEYDSSWTFNATFETVIEWDDNELGYEPLDYSISNYGWCGTNAFGFVTQPQVQVEDGAVYASDKNATSSKVWGDHDFQPNYAVLNLPEVTARVPKRPRVTLPTADVSCCSQRSPVTPDDF